MSFSHVPKKRKVQPKDFDEVSCATNDNDLGATAHCTNDGFADPTGVEGKPPPRGLFTVLKFGGSSVGSPLRLAQVMDTLMNLISTPTPSEQPNDDAAKNQPGRVAVVVSAQGNTTDWLLDAIDFASKGDLEEAHKMVDRITEYAIANSFAANSVPQSNGASPNGTGTPTELATPRSMPAGFVEEIRTILSPLRKLLEGMSLLRESTPQGLDYALSFGERLSAHVMVRLLRARGVKSKFVDARMWNRTDCHFGNAAVDWEKTRRNVEVLWHGWGEAITVHTGFIGQTEDGRTTTLGRNGSDYTATLLAASLQASRVVINTDVPGVMTADPNIVSDAVPVAHLTYSEALELAVYGSRLFHPRTFTPLMKTGVPMLIRNTMDTKSPGTLISENSVNMETGKATCVTSLENLAMVEVSVLRHQSSANHRIGQLIASCLEELKCTVYMETKAAHCQNMSVVIPESELEPVEQRLNKELAAMIADHEVKPLVVIKHVTMLSIVIENLRTTADVASRVTGTLGALDINILAMAEGCRSLTCLINGDETAIAVRGVHTAFNLSRQQCSLFVLGARQGVRGSATTASNLVRVISEQSHRLQKEQSLNLCVVGALAADGDLMYAVNGINTVEAANMLQKSTSEVNPTIDLQDVINKIVDLPNPIVVDCSCEATHEAFYEQCMRSGINVVISSPASVCRTSELFVPFCRKRRTGGTRTGIRGASIHIDGCVGGSLPLLQTIRSLQRSGDRLTRIELALSSSINSITTSMAKGLSISQAVRGAIENRYMESDPRIDLLGLDFAQKLVVIARCLGTQLTEAEVDITPMVPVSVLGQIGTGVPSHSRSSSSNDNTDGTNNDRGSVATTLFEDEVHRAIVDYDPEFQKTYIDQLPTRHQVRFIGTMEFEYNDDMSQPVGVKATLAPTIIDERHPLTRIRDKEVYVALTTESYHRITPLTMYGAGQGGEEGATGLLADIIRVAQRLRGE
eukprot:m.16711 g.16711  ORF g.16711 m.16711 type:complete len:974 (+) comp11169_c0_seq1:510-3431(+)